MKLLLLVLTTAVVAFTRFHIPTHALSLPGAYEAVAHLFVGSLLGAFAVTRSKNPNWLKAFGENLFTNVYLQLSLVLSGVELFAFFTLPR